MILNNGEHMSIYGIVFYPAVKNRLKICICLIVARKMISMDWSTWATIVCIARTVYIDLIVHTFQFTWKMLNTIQIKQSLSAMYTENFILDLCVQQQRPRHTQREN